MNEIELRLHEFERRLLSTDVRHSMETVSTLLADSFIEFGCSGRVYNKSQTVAALRSESPAHWDIHDYRITFLAADIALATYKAVKLLDDTEEKLESLRSSVWIESEGEWKLFFHQGTPLGNSR